MSILLLDPFEGCPTGSLVSDSGLKRYLNDFNFYQGRDNDIFIINGFLSSKCVRSAQGVLSNYTYFRWNGSIENKKIIVGFAFSISGTISNTGSSFIPDPAGSNIITFSSNSLSRLRVNEDWSLSVGNLTTQENMISDSSYSYIEIEVDTITGLFELYVNNVSVGIGEMTFTGDKYIQFGSIGTANKIQYYFYDDIYILDDEGASFNQRLGPIRAVRVPFNATTEANFTPFGEVDNITAINKDNLNTSTFNRSPGANNVGDYFKLDTSVLPSDRPIIAVQQKAMYRKTDIGERSLKLVAKEGIDRKELPLPEKVGDFSGGPAQILGTALDSSVWDLTKLAATDFGYEVTE